MSVNPIPEIIRLVTTIGERNLPTEDCIKQYDPRTHLVFDTNKRKKRKNMKAGEDVNRVAIPMQKIIVKRRAAFMNTGNMTVVAKPVNPLEERLLEMVKRCRTENKMEFKSTEIAERMMSELQVAELWYSEEVDKGYWGETSPTGIARMRMKVISPVLGDKLYPVFNSEGELVLFGRGYKSKKDNTKGLDVDNIESLSIEIKDEEVEHLDIYSKTKVLKFEMENGAWALVDTVPYSYGKLPIIYYSQERPEWYDVQVLIERLEKLWSNFADVIDANSSPILYAKGIIKSMPDRNETAKILNIIPQLNSNGDEVGESDLKYITWDSTPEAISLESDNLKDATFSNSDTADLSTSAMANMGALTGAALDRVFIGSHLAAMRHTKGNYGECVQRSLNFLVSACIAIDTTLKPAANLQLSPEFPIFRINDERETVDMLIAATGGAPLMSNETAVGASGLVKDPEKEWEKIKAEQSTLTPAGVQKEVEDEQ